MNPGNIAAAWKSKAGVIELIAKAAICTAFFLLVFVPIHASFNASFPTPVSGSGLLTAIRVLFTTKQAFIFCSLFGLFLAALLKEELASLPIAPVHYGSSLALLALSVAFGACFFWMKYRLFAAGRLDPALILAQYAFLTAGIGGFLLAVFDLRFVQSLISRHRKKVLAVCLLTITTHAALYAIIAQSAHLYCFRALPHLTARVVYLLLKLTHSNAYASFPDISEDFPGVGLWEFEVAITPACSGIESLGLFTVLFAGILAYERKRLSVWKVAPIFALGIVGAFLTNALRVYLLILIGGHLSAYAALNIFHANAGWILFIFYFYVFASVAYPQLVNKNR